MNTDTVKEQLRSDYASLYVPCILIVRLWNMSEATKSLHFLSPLVKGWDVEQICACVGVMYLGSLTNFPILYQLLGDWRLTEHPSVQSQTPQLLQITASEVLACLALNSCKPMNAIFLITKLFICISGILHCCKPVPTDVQTGLKPPCLLQAKQKKYSTIFLLWLSLNLYRKVHSLDFEVYVAE